jgi:hypothetical protein
MYARFVALLLMGRARQALAIAAALALGVVAPSAAEATSSPLTWSAPRPIDNHSLVAIRCPTTTSCIAIDGAGNVLTTRPAGAAANGWKRYHLDRALAALACPSASLCVAVDSNGFVLTSRKPGGGAKTWTKTLVDRVDPRELSAVGCRSNLCVTGDNQGNAFVSTNPTGGRHAWKAISLPSNGDSPGIMSGLACPAKSLCVGVDQSTGEGFTDDVYTSTKPTSSRSWKLTTEFNNNSFNGVACPTKSLCLAPSAAGEVMTSTSPTGAHSWHATTLLNNVSINAVACSSVSLCVLGDDSGAAETSTDPTGGASAWASQSIAPGDAIESLACPSRRFCLAVTKHGDAVLGSG